MRSRESHLVRLADRLHLGLGAVAMRVEVVVGQAEEHEVVGAVGDEVLGDAGRVLVPGAGPSEARPAAGRAARVEVAVEELVRAPDGVAEVGGGGGALDEALETELIRRLISSYFAIVRESTADQVPKAVMHLLVNHSKDVVQNRLVSELYKEELFEELLYEDDAIKSEREKCEKLLGTYKEAAKIIGEVL